MEKRKRISAFREWKDFTVEYLEILFGDKKNLLISLMFPLLAAFIVVWIAGANMYVQYEGTKSGNFVIVSAAIWGGLFNSIQTVVKDRANVKRSYVAGARIRCYTLSRALIQFLLCVFQSAILTVSYVGVQMKYDNEIPDSGIIFGNTLVEFFVTILLLMYAADAMGLMISCIVRKEETANVMAPYILIVQLIFSGILFDMEGAANAVSYIMISRWGMEALGSTSNLNDLPLRLAEQAPMLEKEFEERFDATSEHILMVWGILLIFSIVSIILGNILLHRVSKDSK